MSDIEKEIAMKVILPKLKKIAETVDIRTISDLRKAFNNFWDESISAAKFQDWIDLLEITFEKKIVITWPESKEEEKAKEIEEEENNDDEMTRDFPAGGADRAHMDAFGQLG